MKLKMMLAAVVLLVAVNIVSADSFVSVDGLSQFDIDFVTISGDTNPTSGYGIVNGDYRMGKLEISNDQFAKFASNNPFWTGGGISANMVTWFEAAQFVNYLNTSTGNQAAYKFTADVMGLWEDGDDGYDASNPFRNSNAKYFMPTEDEWVKAAYWNGTSLQTYATVNDATPVAGVDSNYGYSIGQPWNIGSGSEELNGTFDMMGNVWEWTESPYYSGEYLSGSDRGMRGCSFDGYDYGLGSSDRIGHSHSPYNEGLSIGFRVASTVPEPCSLVLLGLGGLVLRRRKR